MDRGGFCSSWRLSRTNTALTLSLPIGMLAGLLLISGPIFAQANQGRILGSVRDQTGGAIAGATVTVRDLQKGLSRTLTTDDAGEYAAPNLDPSTYEIKVEFKGFKTSERQGLQIGVGQEARIDFTLEPGEQTQTVTVTEAIPLIETTTATLNGNITAETINDLPLNGRNYINLLTLRPGYVNLPGGGGGNQSAMGMRPGDSFFVVDGLNNYEWSQGQQIINGYGPAGDAQTLLPIDAIEQFNIQQNPKAEFGWKPGVQVNMGLKSGTNSIHGSAFAFGRDGSWDALNYFQPAGIPAPPGEFEQYGATAGGPIKKDKLFWYTAFEAQRYSFGLTTAIFQPVDVAGGGPGVSIVDACKALGPAKITPLSAQLAGLNPNTCVVSPASPTVENIFDFNPGTQFPANPNEVVPNGLATVTNTNTSYNGLAKVDYHPSERSTLSGMFFVGHANGNLMDNPSFEVSQWWISNLPVRDYVGTGSWTWVPNSNWVNELRVGYSHQHSDFYSNDHTANPDAPWGLSGGIPTGYGMNTGITNPTFFGSPLIALKTCCTRLGGPWPKFVGPNDNTEFLDHMSYLHGNHALKFGGELTFVDVNGGATQDARGLINFKKGGGLTDIENFLEGNVGSGSSLFVGDPIRHVHNENYALFFQDDYRVSPRVTANIGVRWELSTVPVEANNQIGNFDPTLGFVQVGDGITSPWNGNHHNFSPRLGIAWDISGNQKTVIRAAFSMLYEFVPFSAYMNSVGNAAGLGKIPTGAQICVAGVCTPGRGNIASATINPDPGALSAGWQNNGPGTPIFNGGIVACGDGSTVTSGPASLIGTSPAPCTTAGFARNLNTPYVETWNLDIQHSFTNNLSLEVAYVGNHGVKLYGTYDQNAPPVGAGWGNPAIAGTPANLCLASASDATPYDNCSPGAELGPYSAAFPYIQYIVTMANMYHSSYHAAQVVLTQRSSHGLAFTAAYTYSHGLDDVSENFGSTIPLNNSNPGASMYGNSDFNLPHRFTLELTYALPGRKSPGQILEGWQLNSIATLQKGEPWAVEDTSNDFSGTGELNNPNAWGEAWDFFGNPKDFTSSPTGIPYFPGTSNAQCLAKSTALGQLAVASLANTGCYVNNGSMLIPPPYGQYGTIGRNIFLGTPFRTWDLSIQKNWKFKERLTAQFRAEFFNVLNHPLFGSVDSVLHLGHNDPSSPGVFGTSNETADQASGNAVLGSGANRDVQLGLKLIF